MDCEVPGSSERALCGSLTVYENREARSGRTIDLAVMVLPATGVDPRPDPVFLLAGGPGQAAIALAPAIDQILPSAVRRNRDIVLVDQRGTGGSGGLQCEIEDLDEILASLAFKLPAHRLRACRDGFDADLRLYTTPIAMDDLDDVREALGYERINLWGGSYGTRAALVYLRRHGERVRAAVLRGVAPTDATLPLFFARDAERALELLSAACGAEEACETAYPGFRADLEALLAHLRDTPAPVRAIHPLTQDTVDATITADALVGGIHLIQYGTPFSRHIPRIIDAALRGDYEPFLSVALPFAGLLIQQIHIGMFLSVVCTEDVPYVEPQAAEVEAEGTYVGDRFSLYMIQACEGWPVGELPENYREPTRSDVPVLVVSGDEDPVTPPSWGEEALRYLPNGAHLVIPRTGHFPTAPGCSADLIARFLEEGGDDGLDAACLNEILRPPFTIGAPPATAIGASGRPGG